MIIAILAVLGLCLGSFVNALVWRLHTQAVQTKKDKHADKDELSITKGRSMCPHCRHALAAKDLIPLLSWLFLRGKCRYCGHPISRQYPIVEVSTAVLFIASYLWWPISLTPYRTSTAAIFILWLMLSVGFMALVVYDAHWKLLPDRIMRPLIPLALVFTLLEISLTPNPGTGFLKAVLSVVIGGGVFYLLFQVSGGKWIGGGDVKLGWLLGLIVGTPGKAILFIFFGSVLGSLVSIPLLSSGRLTRNSVIPFGPFLIAGAVLTVLFGTDIINWYTHQFLHI